jgi:hypothetical protein
MAKRITLIIDLIVVDILAVALTFQVKIVFEEPQPGVTIVNLTHTDVPEEDRLVLLMACLSYSLTYNELLLILSLNFGIRKQKRSF